MKRTRSTNLENLEKQRDLIKNKIFLLRNQLYGIEKSINRLNKIEKEQSDLQSNSSVSGFHSK